MPQTAGYHEGEREFFGLISGQESVAALIFALLPLDRDLVNRILANLEEDELVSISAAAKRCGVIPADDLKKIIGKFIIAWREGPSLIGSKKEMDWLFDTVLEGKAKENVTANDLDESRAQSDPVTDYTEVERIMDLVDSEPSYLAAQVLRSLSPDVITLCISKMPPHKSGLIFAEMLRDCVPSELITEAIAECVSNTTRMDVRQRDLVESRVASVLNHLKRSEVDQIIETLRDQSPEQAEKIASMLFDFEDIDKLPPGSISVLFEQVPIEKVIAALHEARPEIASAVLGALGARARRMVEQELANGQKPQSQVIEEARRNISRVALDLVELGKIEVPK